MTSGAPNGRAFPGISAELAARLGPLHRGKVRDVIDLETTFGASLGARASPRCVFAANWLSNGSYCGSWTRHPTAGSASTTGG